MSNPLKPHPTKASKADILKAVVNYLATILPDGALLIDVGLGKPDCGFCDLLLLWRGRIMFVAVKALHDRPTKADQAFEVALRDTSFRLYRVIRSCEDARQMLVDWDIPIKAPDQDK